MKRRTISLLAATFAAIWAAMCVWAGYETRGVRAQREIEAVELAGQQALEAANLEAGQLVFACAEDLERCADERRTCCTTCMDVCSKCDLGEDTTDGE